MLTICVYILLLVQSTVFTVEYYDAKKVKGFDELLKSQSSSNDEDNSKNVNCYINKEDIGPGKGLQLYEKGNENLTRILLKPMNSSLSAEKGDFDKEFEFLQKVESIEPPISRKVYFCIKDGTKTYVALEPITKGLSAINCDRKAPISLNDRLKIYVQLLRTVSSLHEANIAYCDISNSKIGYSMESHLYIFKNFRSAVKNGSCDYEDSTKYLAPEFRANKDAKSEKRKADYSKADIYALGLVFWYREGNYEVELSDLNKKMIAGEEPFEAIKTKTEKIAKISLKREAEKNVYNHTASGSEFKKERMTVFMNILHEVLSLMISEAPEERPSAKKLSIFMSTLHTLYDKYYRLLDNPIDEINDFLGIENTLNSHFTALKESKFRDENLEDFEAVVEAISKSISVRHSILKKEGASSKGLKVGFELI